MSDRKLLAIAVTPHSGYANLSEWLKGLGCLGSPQEYFNEKNNLKNYYSDKLNISNPDEYARSLISYLSSPNGVFSFVVDFTHIGIAERQIAFSGMESEIKFLYLTRSDLLKQAVEFYFSRRSGVWNLSTDIVERIDFDLGEIHSCLNYLINGMSFWEKYFSLSGHDPFRLDLSQFLENPYSTTLNICDYMRVNDTPRFEVSLEKPDAEYGNILEEWCERVRQSEVV